MLRWPELRRETADADRLKLIYWDGSGLVMAYKRLEEHTFTWPNIRDGLITLPDRGVPPVSPDKSASLI